MPVRAILGLALIALAGVQSGDASTRTAGQTKTSVWFHAGPGPASRVFMMRQPNGIVRLTRLTTTRGIRASASALTVPRLAGVRVSNQERNLGDFSPCRRRGALEICTQSQEACPMQKAVWRVRLLKTGGPPGLVRFDFVVG